MKKKYNAKNPTRGSSSPRRIASSFSGRELSKTLVISISLSRVMSDNINTVIN